MHLLPPSPALCRSFAAAIINASEAFREDHNVHTIVARSRAVQEVEKHLRAAVLSSLVAEEPESIALSAQLSTSLSGSWSGGWMKALAPSSPIPSSKRRKERDQVVNPVKATVHGATTTSPMKVDAAVKNLIADSGRFYSKIDGERAEGLVGEVFAAFHTLLLLAEKGWAYKGPRRNRLRCIPSTALEAVSKSKIWQATPPQIQKYRYTAGIVNYRNTAGMVNYIGILNASNRLRSLVGISFRLAVPIYPSVRC